MSRTNSVQHDGHGPAASTGRQSFAGSVNDQFQTLGGRSRPLAMKINEEQRYRAVSMMLPEVYACH